MWSKSVDTFGMGSTIHYLYDLRPIFKHSLFLHLLNEEDNNNNSINNDIYLITSSWWLNDNLYEGYKIVLWLEQVFK